MNDLNERLRRVTRIAAPEPALERLLDRRGRKHRNSRIASLIVAFAVVGAGLAGAAIAFVGHGGAVHHGTQFASGASLVAGPGQYYYTKTQIYYDEYAPGETDRGVQGPWTIEMWFGPDASGRAVFVEDKAAAGRGVSYGWNHAPDATYGPGKMPWGDLSNLSSDPSELYSQLHQRSMPGGASPNPIPTSSPGRSEQDSALLRTMQDLFDGDEQFTPPAVRAAMFDIARGITGVETLNGIVDPVGRPAVGLRWEISYPGSAPSVVEWFFDPSSKQLMAETWSQDGKVIQARIVTEAGIADSTDGPPQAADRFFPAASQAPSFMGQ